MAGHKLKLYGHPWSRASVAHYMLEELGEPYDYHILDLQKGDHKKPDYLAVNPMGKVPALKDGDMVMTEVAAICCYLADTYPRNGLAPAIGDPLRGPYLKWLFFGPSVVEPAMMEKMFGWQIPRRGAAGWNELEAVLDVISDGISKGPYILGQKFTAADVVIGSGLAWGMLFSGIPERPEFTAYTARIAERPASKRHKAKEEEILGKAES